MRDDLRSQGGGGSAEVAVCSNGMSLGHDASFTIGAAGKARVVR